MEYHIFSSFYCREWIKKEVLNQKSRGYSVRLFGWRLFDRGSCCGIVFLQEKSVVTTESVSKPKTGLIVRYVTYVTFTILYINQYCSLSCKSSSYLSKATKV